MPGDNAGRVTLFWPLFLDRGLGTEGRRRRGARAVQCMHDMEVFEQPGALPTRWFFRESPHAGLWLPFPPWESAQLEEACESAQIEDGGRDRAGASRGVVLFHGQRRAETSHRRMQYVATGAAVRILLGTWYFARSDGLLQPLGEDVAGRLGIAVQQAREAHADPCCWTFDAGEGRTIVAAVGGGFVQRSAAGVLRLVTRLYATADSSHRAYAVLKAAPLQCASDSTADPTHMTDEPESASHPELWPRDRALGMSDQAVACEAGGMGDSRVPGLLETDSDFSHMGGVVEACGGKGMLEVPEGTGEQWFYSRDRSTAGFPLC